MRKHLKTHAGFWGLCVLFLWATQVYAWYLSPFEGFDEPEHFAYVLILRQERRLPDPRHDAHTPIQQQVSQPPLYYTVAALFSLPVDVHGLTAARVTTNPWLGFAAPPHSADNRNYALMNPRINALEPDQTALVNALTWTRRVSVLFGLAALAGAYWAGLALWAQQRQLALLAAALMLFMPSVLQMYATVTNDAAVITFSILVLACSMHLYQRWQSRRLLLISGIMMGLAGLSKVSGLALFPIPFLAVLFGWWPNRRQPAALQSLIRAWLNLLLPALVICGWWYLRGLVLFNDPFGTIPHQTMDWGHQTLQPLSEAAQRLPVIMETLWFNAGWGEVRPPPWTQIVPAIVLVMGLAGWLLMPFVRHRRVDIRALLLVVTLMIGLAALLRWMQMADLITGRLYLPFTFALVLLIVWGIWAILPGRVVPILIAIAWITATLILVPSTLMTAFGAPRLMDQPPPDIQGQHIDFGLARFVGYQIADETIAQGESVYIRLCWQAPDGPMPIAVPFPFALQIFAAEDVTVVTGDDVIIASRESFPGLGTYTLWQPGKVFCDAFAFPVIASVEPERIYPLYLTLFDLTTGIGLPAVNSGVNTTSSKIIGYVQGRS